MMRFRSVGTDVSRPWNQLDRATADAIHRSLHVSIISLLLFILSACANTPSTGTAIANNQPTPTPNPTANLASTVSFTLTGGATGNYTIETTRPTSKLRHGHYEFTIDLTHDTSTFFMAFYGYHGPATYALAETTDGGDVHIAFAQHTWDLSPKPPAQCTLTIASDTPTTYNNIDTPTAYTIIDRMRGSFSCPTLLSSNPTQPQPPITLSNGRIDIAMIVES